MKPKVLIIGVFVLAALAIVMFARGHGGSGKNSAGAATKTHTGSDTAKATPGTTTEIKVMYSTEKKEWMEAVTADFGKLHPEIKVNLVGEGSLEAAEGIEDGSLKPTVWSPADSMVMNLLESDWKTKNHSDIVATAGADAPQPLVLTPIVFVAWEDRANALLKASGGTITWKTISKAVTSPQGWLAVGGDGHWGFVKLGHTDPTKSNSGLEALYLMSLEYTGKKKIEVDDLLDPKYQEFVKGIEKGVTKFGTSTGTFMTDMVRFGPSKYDIAIVYENLAISQLANAEGRWGKLRVYYPQTTVWSDHPMALLKGDWVTPAQQAAGRQFVAYLRSKPAQQRALEFGFRPADTSIPIVTNDAQNPFTRLASAGISVDVPAAAETPEGPVVRNLMMMWTRVVKQ